MNIWPIFISGRFPVAVLTTTVLVSSFLANGVFAQSDPVEAEVEVVDPLDKLCAKIGRPLVSSEVAKFAGHIVRGISTDYEEVLGDFTDGRARSVRYLTDGTRTAQYVYTNGRKICLTAPGRDKITCGVPLVCSSGEADYVMVDMNDDPFVQISRPAKPDSNAPLPTVDHDWVTYAGGTTRLSIEEKPIGRQGVTEAKNIQNQDQCRVGGGHPALDKAYAYFWSKSTCNAQFASGFGSVTYVTNVGEIGTIKLGKGTGIETANGQLRWSFPKKPIMVAVKCSNQGDTAIPKSASEVTHIEVDIVLPYSVETGDAFVYTKLVDEVRDEVEQICGKGMIAKETEIRLHRGYDKEVDLALVWNGIRAIPASTAHAQPALQRVIKRNIREKRNAISRFARFIRQSVDAQRTSAILAALREGSELPNIADGMRESDVQTLVALTKGISIRMPWAGRKPDYVNNEFRLSWTIVSKDPVREFFKARRQYPGWVAIKRAVPETSKPQVQLNLTCIVPVRDAGNLESKSWVSVDATMVSFNRDSMVMRCESQ